MILIWDLRKIKESVSQSEFAIIIGNVMFLWTILAIADVVIWLSS